MNPFADNTRYQAKVEEAKARVLIEYDNIVAPLLNRNLLELDSLFLVTMVEALDKRETFTEVVEAEMERRNEMIMGFLRENVIRASELGIHMLVKLVADEIRAKMKDKQ